MYLAFLLYGIYKMLIKPVPLNFIDIDFETRSEIDLKTRGSWVYSEDDTTDVLIMRYQIDGGKSYRWFLGDKPPRRLFRALKKKVKGQHVYSVRAFNWFFEYSLWNNCAAKKYGWPELHHDRFYCSQADAQRLTFPGNLENAALAMNLLQQKDPEGSRLIQMFSKPSRKQGEHWKEPANYMTEFLSFDRYCDQDVKTQIAVSEYTGSLPELEYNIFRLTQRMDVRGVPIDVEMVKGAMNLLVKAKENLNSEWQKLSKKYQAECDKPVNLSQTAKVRDWLAANGLPLPNMQAKTIARKLKEDGIKRKVRRVLTIYSLYNKTSTSKFKKALQIVGKDGWIHDILAYHRATTGRWGGKGLQIQNLARPDLAKWVDYDYICELIADEDYDLIEMLYGDVIKVLSSSLRSMIKAPKGFKFVAADYAQIEARVAFWYADEQEALYIFSSGGDIYCDMASDIFNMAVTKANEFERFIGKQVVLGLGFQMAAPKFKKNMYDQFDITITKEFSENAVKIYRNRFKKIVKLWNETNKAAINAVENRGEKFKVAGGKITFYVRGDYLCCLLPSGREIVYYKPRVERVAPPASWESDEPIKQITYMGLNSVTRKWERQSTYGGSLFQSATQALARDLMANGMLTAEAEGYETLFTVHDEAIALVPDSPNFTYEEYEKLLATTPTWAAGIPVVAEGWEGMRYRK